MWLCRASTKTPLGFSSASPLPKYEERDLEGDPSRSTHRPPDKAFKIQECHCFGASDHRSSFSQYISYTAIDMFNFASNLIKVCCFEVTEDFRMLIHASHIFSSNLSGQEYGQNCLTASSGERVCFTSTRRFEVFADQPSPHDSTRLQLPKNLRVVQKKSMVLISYKCYRSFGNISPFSKNGFAVEILTLQQNQLPQKSAGQKPTTCWQQTLSQVEGQLMSIAPIVFSAQRSTSRVQTGLTGIQHGSTDYLH